ncbi:aspartate/glutamate racemase family protein [Prauserella cavernicola]|uniref:Aspartate/glutamate racemase family protein n=1 Tax=Prauserella cavernicola TaxID=2800127 RepID=A0A934QPK0_9PSEU|nr:aspartate/glutamate racemase family protein [Prauserella cavernicola]MBK1783812.1 aspartate/glutamate racemase family protein [Prauserella cavernicola]
MSAAPFVGVVRVLTTSDQELLTAHGRAITDEHGIATRSVCIPDQPHGVFDPDSHAAAAPKIVAESVALAESGAAAIVISCAADPALAEARAAVPVPVLGAGSTSAAVAAAVSNDVGVLGINDQAPEAVSAVLGSRLVAYRRPEGVRKTTDLLTEQGRRASLAAVGALVDDGASTILFSCTGLTSIALGPEARAAWSVPVVDAVRATGSIAALHVAR